MPKKTFSGLCDMAGRKYIRIALSNADVANMAQSKEAAQAHTGLHISDSMFVLSVLRRAIKP
jgi:hypothetical protein